MANELMFISEKVNEFLNYALHNAVKYKFDPVIGSIHLDYLERIKKIMDKPR